MSLDKFSYNLLSLLDPYNRFKQFHNWCPKNLGALEGFLVHCVT